MSWDPKTTSLVPYQEPIDFYKVACEEVLKTISSAEKNITQIAQDINSFPPAPQSNWNGRKITVLRAAGINKDITAQLIKKLEKIISSINDIQTSLDQIPKGFKKKFAVQICVVNLVIPMARNIAIRLLTQHSEVLRRQQR